MELRSKNNALAEMRSQKSSYNSKVSKSTQKFLISALALLLKKN